MITLVQFYLNLDYPRKEGKGCSNVILWWFLLPS